MRLRILSCRGESIAWSGGAACKARNGKHPRRGALCCPPHLCLHWGTSLQQDTFHAGMFSLLVKCPGSSMRLMAWSWKGHHPYLSPAWDSLQLEKDGRANFHYDNDISLSVCPFASFLHPDFRLAMDLATICLMTGMLEAGVVKYLQIVTSVQISPCADHLAS